MGIEMVGVDLQCIGLVVRRHQASVGRAGTALWTPSLIVLLVGPDDKRRRRKAQRIHRDIVPITGFGLEMKLRVLLCDLAGNDQVVTDIEALEFTLIAQIVIRLLGKFFRLLWSVIGTLPGGAVPVLKRTVAAARKHCQK